MGKGCESRFGTPYNFTFLCLPLWSKWYSTLNFTLLLIQCFILCLNVLTHAPPFQAEALPSCTNSHLSVCSVSFVLSHSIILICLYISFPMWGLEQGLFSYPISYHWWIAQYLENCTFKYIFFKLNKFYQEKQGNIYRRDDLWQENSVCRIRKTCETENRGSDGGKPWVC